MATIMTQSTEPSLKPAHWATLNQLIKTVLPVFLSPVPCRDTLREWFEEAEIPRFKANPAARRGGGPNYYSVAAVETFFRSHTI
jgi:hypothetical protein